MISIFKKVTDNDYGSTYMRIKKHLVNRMLKNWEKRDRKILEAQAFPPGIKGIIDLPYIKDGKWGKY